IPYRVVQLCSGDIGFNSTKTFDIEVWSPGVGEWLEVSSASNCLDFQARRANIRYKQTVDSPTRFPHMLNASGHATLGPRPTWTYFAVAVCASLAMETLGTGTGWPFGNYGYTEGLGAKLFGRVPWSIPLSWYYLSFASYLSARHVLLRVAPRAPFAATVLLSTWLLTAWDLVLDPAMAHPDRHMSFWIWHQRGAYLGMPLVNLAGWMVTGALIIVVTRLALGAEPDVAHVPRAYPYAVYLTNLGFGVILCASAGLWAPILLALAAGIAPASVALIPSRPSVNAAA
ncbi:MAG TPA: carotenoid biosynthesis protein, partial [Myxococcota bacterium]|nr:carotenoid biosynthesis protein [Myxococcota bacterium]